MEVQFEYAGAFLIAKVSGVFSLPAMLSIVEKIAAEARARQAQRVLVESFGVTGDIPDIDRYDLGKRAAEMLLHVERVAILRPAHLSTGFGIDVARNRGLDIRAFLDAKTAEDWLNAS
jgi:hypothetical protein